MSALMKLLDLLREQKVLTPRRIEAIPLPRARRMIEKYRSYLREERDLANGQSANMVPFVDRFLAQKYPHGAILISQRSRSATLHPSFLKQATELGSVQAKHYRFRRSGAFRD